MHRYLLIFFLALSLAGTGQAGHWEDCLAFDYRVCDGSDLAERAGDSYSASYDPNMPCRNLVLQEMVLDITAAMESLDIVHWVSHGTLLGAVRNRAIIPWTADVDVSMMKPAKVHASASHGIPTPLKQKLNDLGYHTFYESGEEVVRVCISAAGNHPAAYHPLNLTLEQKTKTRKHYLDFFPYGDIYLYQAPHNASKPSARITCRAQRRCAWLPDTLLPPKRYVQFETLPDTQLYGPSQPEAYLTVLYGAKYMSPPAEDKRGIHGTQPTVCQ